MSKLKQGGQHLNTTSTGPPALQDLEEDWRGLDYKDKLRIRNFCAFMMESWTEHAPLWTDDEKRQFLHSFDVFLGDRIADSRQPQPWRTDTIGIPMPVEALVTDDFRAAYWREFKDQ